MASEAVGNNDGAGTVLPEFLVDIDSYLANIARFSRLDIEVLCPGHKLVLTGADAREHLRARPRPPTAISPWPKSSCAMSMGTSTRPPR